MKYTLNYKEDYKQCTVIEPGAASGKMIVFGFTCLACNVTSRFNSGYYLEKRDNSLWWHSGVSFNCRYCKAKHTVDTDLNLTCQIELDVLVSPNG